MSQLDAAVPLTDADTRLTLFLKHLAQWSFSIITGISAVSFIGWAWQSPIISGFNPSFVPIAPSTALCFFILGASLLDYVLSPEKPLRRLLAGLSASLVTLLCSIILIAFVMKVPLEVEHLGFYPPAGLFPFPLGHMSPLTALCFIAASLTVLLLLSYPAEGKLRKKATPFLAGSLLATAFIVLLGYLYGSPVLYGGRMIPMAFPTAAAFAFLGLGLTAACGPHTLPVRLFFGASIRSRLLRAFLPTIAAFFLLQGLIYITTLPQVSNPALISAAIAIIFTAFLSIVIANLASSIGSEIDFAHGELAQKEAALRLSEATLRESEEKFRLLAHSAQDAIILIDKQGNVSFWNEAAERFFGYSSREAIGENCRTLVVPPRHHEIYERDFLNFVATGMSGAFGKISEMKAMRKDGTEFPVEVSLSAANFHGNRFAVAIVRDIGQRKQSEALIQALAITDQLTGLYNRRGLLTHAEQQLRMVERTKKGILLFFADLDDLKQVNDKLGHRAGDAALVEATQILKAVFRKTDIIARIGGDEFAVLAPDAAEEYAAMVEKRLQDQLALHNAGPDRQYELSISIGMAYCDPEHPRTLDEMLSRADSRMYEQKRLKRHRQLF